MSIFRRLSRMDRDYANFRRYLEIIEVLARFGFDELFGGGRGRCRVRKMLHRSCPAAMKKISRPERVRLLLEELGPTFVKLGQILATRPDLIPGEYVRAFATLQEHVAPFPFSEVQTTIENCLGKPLSELYASFEEKPLAAASIGQVHRAVTRDHVPVVVKIARPGIRKKITVDLEILYHLAYKLEHSDLELKSFRPTAIVEEFARVLKRELDFRIEAVHARRFAQMMSKQEGMDSIRIYEALSGEFVITMEQAHGLAAAELLKHEEWRDQFDLKLIAERGAKALMAQIFQYGFFHADPHPGNIFLSGRDRICFIDFGMMGRVSQRERQEFCLMLKYLLAADYGRLTEYVLRITTPMGEKPPNRSLLERDIADLAEANLYLPMRELSLAKILEQIQQKLREHELALPPNLYVMFKALITIEGVARNFDPELEIMKLVRPFMRRIQLSLLNPKRHVGYLIDSLGDYAEIAQAIPGEVHDILEQTRSGELKIRLEHRNLEIFEETVRSAIERVSYAIVLAALVVASSIVVLAKVPPLYGEVSLMGVVGYSLSAFMGFVLLFTSTGRRKRR